MTESIKRAVADAIEVGICVVPPAQDGTKRPDVSSWSQYQKKPPTQARVDMWYEEPRTGIGWVCGKVSGNLEIIDFDDRATYEEYRKAAEGVGLGALVLRIERGYLEFSPNGAHWPYFCTEIEGNTKLAARPEGEGVKTLIETRGEGGYIIVAPTHGSVNRSGEYKLLKGGVGTIAKITPAERKRLHDLARTFDRLPVNPETHLSGVFTSDGRPGDDYSSKTPWAAILEPAGWKKVYNRLDVSYWRRPGRTYGTQATTGHGGDYLHVFSTSTNLPANKSMGKFTTYAHLEHGGDFGKAAKALRLLGFGDDPMAGVDISGIADDGPPEKTGKNTVAGADPKTTQKQPKNNPEPNRNRTGTDMQELLHCPGMIGELATWINETSPKPQPVLALGASIAAVATVIGRKVKLESGLRPNLYVLGVAPTGAGKERARQAIRAVFDAGGISELCGYDDIASDAGIMTALQATPSCLFMLDEFGRVLKLMASDRAPAHIANQVTSYLRLYGASEGVYHSKTYVDKDKWIAVDQPSLCIYGTTVPSRLHDAMTSDQVSDGLLSRFLVFESTDPDPRYVPLVAKPPPQGLIDKFKEWKASTNGGDLEDECGADPRVVTETNAARSVFMDMEEDLHRKRAEIRKDGGESGMYTRVGTAARKLAMIRACGIKVMETDITESCAEWGAKLALRLTDDMARSVRERVSDNQVESDLKEVLRAVKRKGRATNGEVASITSKMGRQQRTDSLRTLLEMGKLKVEERDGKKAFEVVS